MAIYQEADVSGAVGRFERANGRAAAIRSEREARIEAASRRRQQRVAKHAARVVARQTKRQAIADRLPSPFTTATGFTILLLAFGALVKRGHDIDVENSLIKPAVTVRADLQRGEINPNDVIKVAAPVTGYAYTEAAKLSDGTGDVLTLTDEIVAQNGGDTHVAKGTEFFLSVDDVGTSVIRAHQRQVAHSGAVTPPVPAGPPQGAVAK